MMKFKSYENILAQVGDEFRAAYGADVYLGPESSDGQAVAIMAQALFDLEVLKVVNEPGMTWKVRRAILREMGVIEDATNLLVKEDDPADY